MKTSDKWQVTGDKLSNQPRSTSSRYLPLVTRHSSAFTLIEIMVAIVIFAMLVSAVYATWVLILKSTRIAQEAAAQVQRQRIAIRTIEDSLTCIQSFQASMQYYAFGVTNGDNPSLSFVARVPDVFPRNGRFGDFNLRRLTFTVEPAAATAGGSDAENDLVLRQNPMLMDMDPDEQATPLVLARNVKDFVVECWDTNTLDWADEWDDTNSIPPLVRIKLTLGGNATDTGANAPTLSITREIAVPSGTMSRVAQTGSPFNGAGGGGGGVGGGGQPVNQNNPVNSSAPTVPIQPNRPQRNSNFPGGPTSQMPPQPNFPANPP